jgi:hypothetical protein
LQWRGVKLVYAPFVTHFSLPLPSFHSIFNSITVF